MLVSQNSQNTVLNVLETFHSELMLGLSKQAEVSQNAERLVPCRALACISLPRATTLFAGSKGPPLAFSSLRLVEDLAPDHLAYAPDMTS